MVSMHFSVVVLNYNNWKDTVACIESILCSDDTPESIVIIDNNSNDDSVARIQEWAVAAPGKALARREGRTDVSAGDAYRKRHAVSWAAAETHTSVL